ncbi:MAG: hypothetical protein IJX58_07785, partial [Clostridia bacterium]|nr:hypothetical protein [Clostridia bacterium]
LGRLRDRSRKLLEISEVDGIRDGNIALRTIYRFREEGEKDGRVIGGWVMENPPAHLQKLSMDSHPYVKRRAMNCKKMLYESRED